MTAQPDENVTVRTGRRFNARADRIVFAVFSALITLIMVLVLGSRHWTGWSWFFAVVAAAYLALGSWLVPRYAVASDLAMDDWPVPAPEAASEEQRLAYRRAADRQLRWTAVELVVLVGGMALLGMLSSTVS